MATGSWVHRALASSLPVVLVALAVSCGREVGACSLAFDAPLEYSPSFLAFRGTVEAVVEVKDVAGSPEVWPALRLRVKDAVIGPRLGEVMQVAVAELQPDCSERPLRRTEVKRWFRVGKEAIVINTPASSDRPGETPRVTEVALFPYSILPVYDIRPQNARLFDYDLHRRRVMALADSLTESDWGGPSQSLQVISFLHRLSANSYDTLEYLRDLTRLRDATDRHAKVEVLRRVYWYFERRGHLDLYWRLVERHLTSNEERDELRRSLPTEETPQRHRDWMGF